MREGGKEGEKDIKRVWELLRAEVEKRYKGEEERKKDRKMKIEKGREQRTLKRNKEGEKE